MKIRYALLAVTFLTFLNIHAPAATLYVSLNSTNPVPPYTSWSTAATNIQDAIDASTSGDLILVTNGVYANGGRTANGYALTNRVVIDKAVTVQSINGPAMTLIEGNSPIGSNAVRCVYVASGAIISGFTLTNGATLASNDAAGDFGGGGVSVESANVIVTNCILSGNAAYYGGGGAAFATLNNCIIKNNSTPGTGGGTWNSVLSNCTLSGNSAADGGGAAGGELDNCIVSSNSAGNGGGIVNATLKNSIISSNLAVWGGGAYYGEFDNCVLSNNHAYEIGGGVYNGTLNNCSLIANWAAQGGGAGYSFLSNCTLAANSAADGGGTSSGTLINCTLTGNSAYYGGGTYFDTLNGCILTSNSASQYGGGAEGGTLTNCTLTGNSAYYEGGGVDDGTLEGCIINSNSAVQQYGGGASSSTLSNCTLTGNSANSGGAAYSGVLTTCNLINNSAFYGGGACFNTTLIGCILSSNVASDGGGANSCTLSHCLLSSNTASYYGGGTYSCSLSNSTLLGNEAYIGGGGAAFGTLDGCSIVSNVVPLTISIFGGGPTITTNLIGSGGGTYSCLLTNCVLDFNAAGTNGGGDYQSTLVNCTVVSNSALLGGGAFNSKVKNCIIYYNLGGNYFCTSTNDSLNYCCTMPLTNGSGNITNEPLFVNLATGDFRLQSNSPCINSGYNAYVSTSTDLDGNPRIVGGTVDIGAYEYQTPVTKISYAWLQQYGLPVTTNIDTSDLDGTGFNVYQDWIAGLNPTNSLSVLAMLSPVPTNNPAGLVVSWESVSNRTYFLQSSTNLAVQPAFSIIQSNIVGQPDVTSFMDTNAVGSGPFFYRVGVQ